MNGELSAADYGTLSSIRKYVKSYDAFVEKAKDNIKKAKGFVRK